MPPKTVIEKAPSPSPDVTVFKISGTLGFHEKETLEKLFGECKKRRLHRVVFDVQGLTSLGGGCANIIRAAAATGEIVVGFAGAKKTVLKFLQDTDSRIHLSDTVADAVAQLSGAAPGAAAESPPEAEPAGGPERRSAPAAAAAAPKPAPQKPAPAAPRPDAGRVAAAAHRHPTGATEAVPPAASVAGSDRDLQRRIVQYNTLFSLNAEFARLRERRSLIDQFLLTAIAQAGVESAIFLEFNRGYFVPTGFKGIEANEVRGFVLAGEQLKLDEWRRTGEIYTIDDNPFGDDVKAPLLSLGCAYVAPFIVHGAFRGVVLLGNPIKSDLDATTLDFLKILINQKRVNLHR